MIDLSICPTYQCNMNCDFCYLKNHNKNILSLEKLDEILKNIEIRVLDIYGGEITTLPEDYSIDFINIINKYYTKEKLSFITNGLKISDFWKEQFLKNEVAFSIDKSRPYQDIVKENIKEFDKLNKDYCLITVDIDEIDYDFLNSLKNLEVISIKPYSAPLNGKEFNSKMLISYKKAYENNKSLFLKLERVQPNIKLDQRDDIRHAFLLPDGELYDIQYKDNQEYFEKFDNCTQPVDIKCLTCKYYKHCFNDHYSGYNVPEKGDCLGRKEVLKFLDDIHSLY